VYASGFSRPTSRYVALQAGISGAHLRYAGNLCSIPDREVGLAVQPNKKVSWTTIVAACQLPALRAGERRIARRDGTYKCRPFSPIGAQNRG
jgi:hypothetical protein